MGGANRETDQGKQTEGSDELGRETEDATQDPKLRTGDNEAPPSAYLQGRRRN